MNRGKGYWIAQKLVENYQPKLPEDSVVLSREEYEQLEEKIMDLRFDKQELKNEISEKDNKIALLEETIECIKFNVDFTRKETAEKFLQLAYDRCLEKSFIKKVEELARQFGVEIKE